MSKLGPGRHACKACGREYGYRNGLRYHVESTHLSLELGCDLCGRTFATTERLGRHKCATDT